MPAPVGDSSKQVVTKATEMKSESQQAVGIQAVQPFAMGIPMDPAMMQQMLHGTPFLSPITALASQQQQQQQQHTKSGDDQTRHRCPSPSPAHHTNEEGEAVASVVHHTPDQAVVKREPAVDLTAEVPRRKRMKTSCAEGVLSATPPTSGSPVQAPGKREETGVVTKGVEWVKYIADVKSVRTCSLCCTLRGVLKANKLQSLVATGSVDSFCSSFQSQPV